MGVSEPTMTKSTYIEVAGTLVVADWGRRMLYPATEGPYELFLNEGDELRAKELHNKHVIILGHLTPGRVIRVDSIQR